MVTDGTVDVTYLVLSVIIAGGGHSSTSRCSSNVQGSLSGIASDLRPGCSFMGPSRSPSPLDTE